MLHVPAPTWVAPLSSDTKEAVIGKRSLVSGLNDLPYSSFVIIAQGKT